MFAVRVLRHFGARNSVIFRHASPVIRACSTNTQCQKFDQVESDPNKSTDKSDKADNKIVFTKIETKLQIIFTCKKCNTRNDKIISKIAYQKGVVIIRCDGCKNNHLIADNLGWFDGLNKGTNIEKILAAKCETICKIRQSPEGLLVIAEEEKNCDETKSKVNTPENRST